MPGTQNSFFLKSFFAHLHAQVIRYDVNNAAYSKEFSAGFTYFGCNDRAMKYIHSNSTANYESNSLLEKIDLERFKDGTRKNRYEIQERD